MKAINGSAVLLPLLLAGLSVVAGPSEKPAQRKILYSGIDKMAERYEGRIAQWASGGYDGIELNTFLDTLRERSKICGNGLNCTKRWNWLRFACSKQALDHTEFTGILFKEISAYVDTVEELPDVEALKAAAGPRCLTYVWSPILDRLPASDMALARQAALRVAATMVAKDAPPDAPMELVSGVQRPGVSSALAGTLFKDYFKLSHPNVPPAKIAELGYFVILRFGRPDLYADYFNREAGTLTKNPEQAHSTVAAFCVAAGFLGRTDECINHLDKLGGKTASAPEWMKVEYLRAYTVMGNLTAARAALAKIDGGMVEGCGQVARDKMWVAFYAAQIFRAENAAPKSLECINKGIAHAPDEITKFAFSFEAMKTRRLIDSPNAYPASLQKAAALVPKSFGNDSIFSKLIMIEELKNLALAGKQAEFAGLKIKTVKELNATALEAYKPLPAQIESELLNGKQTPALPANFEALDVRVLMNRRAAAVTGNAGP